MRRRKYAEPPSDLTIDDKLKNIAKAFKENLARVANVATNGTGKAKEYAADDTAGMAKKHVVATVFALCEETLHTQLGSLWWRCSMSESQKKTEPTPTKMVKTILAAVERQPLANYDEWPAIEEFMHDFSASSHSIPQVTGKAKDLPWDDKPFQLRFAAESEMAKGGPEIRSHAITRDLIKLCLVECPIKAVVYRGYTAEPRYAQDRASIIEMVVRSILRCPSPGTRNEAWLLIGLNGTWPKKTTPYFHTLLVGDTNAKERDW